MVDEKRYCCEKFRAAAEQAEYTDGRFEFISKEDAYGILGCCGGGCYVVSEMRFCPFCGAPLPLA